MESTPTTHTDCITVAVAILGDKWTPLLVRALADGPLRFCPLQDAAGGVNPRTLSARLSRLEHCGIITKTTYNEVPPHTEYALTAKGRDLLPILAGMAARGTEVPTNNLALAIILHVGYNYIVHKIQVIPGFISKYFVGLRQKHANRIEAHKSDRAPGYYVMCGDWPTQPPLPERDLTVREIYEVLRTDPSK